MGRVPVPVDRDWLELMVAYGFVPIGAVAGARAATAISERTAPTRSADTPSITLAVGSVAPRAGQTSLILGLAHAWSRQGRSVLLVDLDPNDDLGRLLLVGSALTVNTGQAILHTVEDGGLVEPSRTLLPGVDVVLSGGGATWDVDALPRLLRLRPDRLHQALAGVHTRYDRVLIDTPACPRAVRNASALAADAWLYVVPCEQEVVSDAVRVATACSRDPEGPRPLGFVLDRFDAVAPPAPALLEELRVAGALNAAVPRLPGLRLPWDVLSGAAGRLGDAVFRALAEELDARIARWPARRGLSGEAA